MSNVVLIFNKLFSHPKKSFENTARKLGNLQMSNFCFVPTKIAKAMHLHVVSFILGCA